jgi:hypothetical protein
MKTETSNLAEQYGELIELLELQLEERISPEQFARLEAIIRDDSRARRLYLQYVDLHGMLHYDTAAPHVSAEPASATVVVTETAPNVSSAPAANSLTSRRRQPTNYFPAALSCLVLAAVVGLLATLDGDEAADNPKIVESPAPGTESIVVTAPDRVRNTTQDGGRRHGPVRINPVGPETPMIVQAGSNFEGRTVEVVYNAWEGGPAPQATPTSTPRIGNSNSEIVAFINRRIREGWQDYEVTASPQSDDSEWLRRAYLDIVGHIPTGEQAQAFLTSQDPNRREQLVETLLDDEDYVRNWTTIWTNLLVGRSNPREVDRPALKKYLRESFAENRPWDDVVGEFISAQGNHQENGATNFLLAHVNDQALPATATTARLFLGQQLQCLQCHDHPFNDWKQKKFWGFHGFFSQMEVDATRTDVALIDSGAIPEGVFFERRNGLMEATYPEFNGRRFRPEDVDDDTRLREELAELMTTGETTDVAQAFVNRMWQHFFGAAFTPVVDDMGPHAVPSHPELLDGITRSFVRSGYDVKQLVRWITSSEAYQLSSQFSETNQIDDPAIGQMPLFSRAYVKSMTVEQAFDSVMVATRAGDALGSDWAAVDRERQRMQQQFVMQWETEDNDEANLFDGSVPQALMMMNSPLIQTALDSSKGTYIGRVVRSDRSEVEKIEAVAMAALSRRPSAGEIAAVRQLARSGERHPNLKRGFSTSLEDLFWAYLNSNEFILIH